MICEILGGTILAILAWLCYKDYRRSKKKLDAWREIFGQQQQRLDDIRAQRKEHDL